MTFKEVRPVIAVGNPEPNMYEDENEAPFIGATRIYMGENWQTEIKKLMSISKFVIVNAGVSKSVLRELKAAKDIVKPEMLMISFLERYDLHGSWQKGFYQEFEGHFYEIFGTRIPPYRDNLCLVGFNRDGTPYFIAIEGEFLKSWVDHWI